jgi:hypothetical protein
MRDRDAVSCVVAIPIFYRPGSDDEAVSSHTLILMDYPPGIMFAATLTGKHNVDALAGLTLAPKFIRQ